MSHNSVVLNIAVAGSSAAIGIVALPRLFGSGVAADWVAPVWLAAGICASLLLLIVLRQVSDVVAQAIKPSALTPSQARLLGRLVTLSVALIVVQATLRRPLALLLSGVDADSVEAAIAATVLASVLALGVWSYQTAHPMLQAITLQALDAAIPTVNAAPIAEPTRTVSVVGAEATRTARREHHATVRAPREAEARPVLPQSGPFA